MMCPICYKPITVGQAAVRYPMGEWAVYRHELCDRLVKWAR